MAKINILLFGKKGRGLDKPGGAARAMFEYANHLAERNHKVNIFISACNFHPQQYKFYDNYQEAGWSWWKYFEKKISIQKHIRLLIATCKGKIELNPEWFNVKTKIFLVPSFAQKHIPEADATIFTDWWMNLWTKDYPDNRGKKIWFIHTVFFLPPTRNPQKILSFPCKKVVVSNFMREGLRKYGVDEVYLVLNGVNLKQFYNENKVFNKNKRVCMIYFPFSASFKGVKDGIKAFEIVKKKHPEIKLVMFGVEKPKEVIPCDEYYWNPSQEKIREIYSSCDIFLYPARYEASALSPREAMACKCAVVGTTAGGITDYALSEEEALLSEAGDVQALSANLLRLIENEELLKKISLAGYKKICEFSWDNQTKKLEEIIFLSK
ncbi:MAG: glycosyltransferase family 4 protein [Candidatus Omnitrophica bacterium]|nr:glycosyltransferase family 4 protein [Candidatus Omnitrophota bacterium]